MTDGVTLPGTGSIIETLEQLGGKQRQVMHVASAALPDGAATEAKQDDILTALGSPLQAGGAVAVSNLPATQPVSAIQLPLPAGAATEAKQDDILTALGSPLQAGGAVAVSNLPATQPVSATQLPLPDGAATEATIAALKSLQLEVKSLNDTMLAVFVAILEKMPRVTGNDQAAVSVEAGSVAISSGTITTVTNVTNLANINLAGSKFISGDNLNMAGVGYIYDNVKVS